MSRTIAALALCVIAMGLSVGNYWLTFGLWPRSWTSFICFACAQITVSLLLDVVRKDVQ